MRISVSFNEDVLVTFNQLLLIYSNFNAFPWDYVIQNKYRSNQVRHSLFQSKLGQSPTKWDIRSLVGCKMPLAAMNSLSSNMQSIVHIQHLAPCNRFERSLWSGRMFSVCSSQSQTTVMYCWSSAKDVEKWWPYRLHPQWIGRNCRCGSTCSNGDVLRARSPRSSLQVIVGWSWKSCSKTLLELLAIKYCC